MWTVCPFVWIKNIRPSEGKNLQRSWLEEPEIREGCGKSVRGWCNAIKLFLLQSAYWCVYFWTSDVGFHHMGNTPSFTLLCTVKRSQMGGYLHTSLNICFLTQHWWWLCANQRELHLSPTHSPVHKHDKVCQGKNEPVMMMMWPKCLTWFEDGREHSSIYTTSIFWPCLENTLSLLILATVSLTYQVQLLILENKCMFVTCQTLNQKKWLVSHEL